MKNIIITFSIFAFLCGTSGCAKDDTSHPYGAGNGRYAWYFLQDCHNGILTVTIDGQVAGTIGNFYNSAPDCNNSQVFFVVLPAGTHHFHATFSLVSGSYDSDFTIVADQCLSSFLNC